MGLVPLVQNGFLGIVSHAAGAEFVNGFARRHHLPVLFDHFKTGVVTDFCGGVHGVFGHGELVLAVFRGDVESGNAPCVGD